MYELLPESKHIEYKKCEIDLSNDIWETYSAFANTEGGKIILGVIEQKGKPIINGVKNPEYLIDKFWKTIINKSKISENILIEENIKIIEDNNKKIIEITIPEANYKNKANIYKWP